MHNHCERGYDVYRACEVNPCIYSVQDPPLDVVLLVTPYFVKMVQF